MAGTTYRYLANIILDKINQNDDDKTININHIIFWINIVANRLRFERKGRKTSDSGAYLVFFERVSVSVSGRRKYVDMPALILDLDNDNGIHAIHYNQDTAPPDIDVMAVKFERTTPAALQAALNIPIRKPSPSNPFFYRIGKRVTFAGIEQVTVPFVDMYLYTVVDPTVMVSLDTEINVEEDQQQALYAGVMQLIGFGIPSIDDNTNDGSDKALIPVGMPKQSTPTVQPQSDQ